MEFSAASETALSGRDSNPLLCQDLGFFFSSVVRWEYADEEHEEKQEGRDNISTNLVLFLASDFSHP